MPQGDQREEPRIDLSAAPWKMLEFFAGSGLVGYGLKGMFAPVWANDVCGRKAAVYAANFGAAHFLLADIKTVRGKSLPFAHLSWASFPCQDLSLAGAIGGIHAARSGLVWEWLRVLDEMPRRPKILALENVTGLLSAAGGANYRVLHAALVDRGYRCGAILVDAARFLPQSRPRVFVLAVRTSRPLPDGMVGDGPCWLHNDAAARLGRVLPGWIWWRTPEPPPRVLRLEDVIEDDAPFDRDDALRLLSARHRERLNAGGARHATGYRRTRGGEQRLELRFDGLAGCLRTPGGGSSRQYLVVKQGDRARARLLTVREAARLMGAPDNFLLPGGYNDGYHAMGDAVAAPVARFVGERFLTGIAAAVYGAPLGR